MALVAAVKYFITWHVSEPSQIYLGVCSFGTYK